MAVRDGPATSLLISKTQFINKNDDAVLNIEEKLLWNKLYGGYTYIFYPRFTSFCDSVYLVYTCYTVSSVVIYLTVISYIYTVTTQNLIFFFFSVTFLILQLML